MDTQKRNMDLVTMPVPKLVIKLAIPSVIAQVINLLYNIIDRVFIGNIPEIGTVALTGVGVTFPVITLISAFAAFAGQGSAALASIQLGAENREMAEKILGNACFLIFGMAFILMVGIELCIRPVLFAFGASGATVDYAERYLRIYLTGTLFVQITLGLNLFISAQGKPTVAMVSVMAGAIVHLALNPLFIFELGMGVEGAALSTVLSQGVSALWTFRFLAGKRSEIRIRKRYLKPDKKVMEKVSALGIPPFVMQASDSLVSIVMNTGLLAYGGDLYVGAYTIMQSIMQMLVLPVSGLTQGAQAIISYNYGAGNRGRVREAYRWMLGLALAITCTGCAVVMRFPHVFVSFFTSDAMMFETTVAMVPVFFAGIWAFGAQGASQTAFMGMGMAKISLFLALLRKVVLLVPLAYVLPRFTDHVSSIFWSEPVADIIASTTTLLLFWRVYKRDLCVTEYAEKDS